MLDPTNFDKNEYFYYDDPENGEFHEVVPFKFIAFKGPWDDRWYTPHIHTICGGIGRAFVRCEITRQTHRVELQDGSYTLPPSDYIEVRMFSYILALDFSWHWSNLSRKFFISSTGGDGVDGQGQVFKSKNVSDIVRLNSPEYDEEEFVSAGFQFHDLCFAGLLSLYQIRCVE